LGHALSGAASDNAGLPDPDSVRCNDYRPACGELRGNPPAAIHQPAFAPRRWLRGWFPAFRARRAGSALRQQLGVDALTGRSGPPIALIHDNY
jgi:hypothetical protein